MTTSHHHPAGAPCWVESLQPDPRAAQRFYGPLFGWTFDAPTPMPGGLAGDYVTARLDGCLVAGVGQAPPDSPAVWSTHVRVDDVEQALARARQAGGTPLAGPLDDGAAGRLAVLADPAASPSACGRRASVPAPRWSVSPARGG